MDQPIEQDAPPPEVLADQVKEAKRLYELLDTPDGRKSLKKALIQRWGKMEKQEEKAG